MELRAESRMVLMLCRLGWTIPFCSRVKDVILYTTSEFTFLIPSMEDDHDFHNMSGIFTESRRWFSDWQPKDSSSANSNLPPKVGSFQLQRHTAVTRSSCGLQVCKKTIHIKHSDIPRFAQRYFVHNASCYNLQLKATCVCHPKCVWGISPPKSSMKLQTACLDLVASQSRVTLFWSC